MKYKLYIFNFLIYIIIIIFFFGVISTSWRRINNHCFIVTEMSIWFFFFQFYLEWNVNCEFFVWLLFSPSDRGQWQCNTGQWTNSRRRQILPFSLGFSGSVSILFEIKIITTNTRMITKDDFDAVKRTTA